MRCMVCLSVYPVDSPARLNEEDVCFACDEIEGDDNE